jgi:PTS system mannose-specific IID component
MMTPTPIDDRDRERVPLIPLMRVFFRSLLIQVGFNPRAMQGLGFTYAMYPALRALYPNRGVRTAAVRRYLTVFNTHPYFAAAVLGGSVRYEERIASGLASPEDEDGFREALAAPLAAIGDAFFWNALRPACALMAALTAPTIGLWAIAVFLLLYNATHISVRIWLFVIGYRRAEGLVALVGKARFPIGTRLLRRAAAVMAGAVTAELALFAYRNEGRSGLILVGVSALVAVVLAGRVNAFVLLYGALFVALVAGLIT